MQVELVGDKWYRESRFILASASKAARLQIHKQNEIEKGGNAKNSTNMRGTKETPGCSHWAVPQPVANRSSAHSNDSDPGTKQTKTIAKRSEKKGKGYTCFHCKGKHPLFFCPRYLSKTLEHRWDYIKKEGICQLCLLERHSPMECTHGCCRKCEVGHLRWHTTAPCVRSVIRTS